MSTVIRKAFLERLDRLKELNDELIIHCSELGVNHRYEYVGVIYFCLQDRLNVIGALAYRFPDVGNFCVVMYGANDVIPEKQKLGVYDPHGTVSCEDQVEGTYTSGDSIYGVLSAIQAWLKSKLPFVIDEATDISNVIDSAHPIIELDEPDEAEHAIELC